MSSMEGTSVRYASAPVRATGPWARSFRLWYRLIGRLKALLMWLALGRGFGNVVVLRVRGRHTGLDRSLPVGLLTVEGRRYLGHPSGDAAWTLNLRASADAVIEGSGVGSWRFRAVVLERGPEREAVVRATFRQHPFPGNAIYRLARDHVLANGVFFRLEPVEG